jgi:hypothetical protein
MKKILTIIMLCGVMSSYAQNTPPHAASTKTWMLGNRTWSDAIQVLECNKTSFINSNTDPQCRSYTYGGNTFYYYNWPYVSLNATTLCPSPWRVPSLSDFNILADNVTIATIIYAWGLGGHVNGPEVYLERKNANYWSSTVDGNEPYYLLYNHNFLGVYNLVAKSNGFRVRCVKDNVETMPNNVETPRYATSSKTWTFGGQTWSNAIQVPECNKTSFTNNTEPDCRSHTENGKTFYYYNWPYVNANKNILCPSPWRVPSIKDFDRLWASAEMQTLATAWGYGGLAFQTGMDATSDTACMWSASEHGEEGRYLACFGSDAWANVPAPPKTGAQVRCVR